MDTTIATLAGFSFTIGMIATFTTQFVKKYFPVDQRKLFCRIFVATLCVVLSSLAAVYNGDPVSVETVVMAFSSYLTSAAAYDQLFS